METTDFLGNKWDIECMGCAIGNQTMAVPGGIIRQTEHFLVHQDPLIPLPGFLVIASARHIQSISEMQKSEYKELAELVWAARLAVKKATDIDFLAIVQEEHSKHFHLWFFPWTHRVIEQYGRPSLTKIREIMAGYLGRRVDEREWQELKETIEKIRALMPK